MDGLGAVPAYLYDAELIRSRIASLKQSLPDAVSLHYAMKANPMPEVVSLVAGLVDGLDIASAGELTVALTTSCKPGNMSFAGPGKQDWELDAAIDAAITINVESPNELERIAAIAAGREANIALRVNPDFELKSSGMQMSGGAKQFGIDAESIPDVLQRVSQLPVAFRGFHIFPGAQNLRPEFICDAQSKALDLALNLMNQIDVEPTFVNIGGGFGIPYFPGDKPLEISTICDNLALLADRLGASSPNCELVIELGRYLVGEAGVYVCRVVDRKISRGQVFLVTDGGLHHHLAASGNFGQVIRKNYPLAVANRIGAQDTEIVNVVGPLCTPLDILGHKMELAKAEVGDYIAVFQSGAYGFTASPHLFLSHPPPAQLLL
jgi:diaminopimelate decarboxylase